MSVPAPVEANRRMMMANMGSCRCLCLCCLEEVDREIRACVDDSVGWFGRGERGRREAGVADVSELVAAFGCVDHGVRGPADRDGGFAEVLEADDPALVIGISARFAPYLTSQVYPVVGMDVAAKAVDEGIGFRKSVNWT